MGADTTLLSSVRVVAGAERTTGRYPPQTTDDFQPGEILWPVVKLMACEL